MILVQSNVSTVLHISSSRLTLDTLHRVVLPCIIFEGEAGDRVPGVGIQQLRGLHAAVIVAAPDEQGPGWRGPAAVVSPPLH